MPATQRVDQKHRIAIVPMDALRGFFRIMDAWGVSADDAREFCSGPRRKGRTTLGARGALSVCQWIPFEEWAI